MVGIYKFISMTGIKTVGRKSTLQYLSYTIAKDADRYYLSPLLSLLSRWW